jgi:putative MATE family efflux protein
LSAPSSAAAPATAEPLAGSPAPAPTRRFDRSIVEGPIASAVWKLAWPSVLQNAIGGLQGIIDHAMVGHYVGFTANAAIGVSWQIFLVVIVFISSLFTGMGVLVARFAATPAVRAEALPFLRTMFVFSVGILMFFMLGGALRAAGDARTPLRLGIALTVLNIAFNVVLIPGYGPIPALGTRGAAIGTSAASALVSAAGLWLLLSGRLVVSFPRGMSWRPDWSIVRALFRFGLPAGVQGVAMNLAGVALLRFIGSLEHSAEAQAAYAVGYAELFSLITWTSVGLMGAAGAVAGQNLGAGHPDRTMKAVQIAARIGLGVAAGVGALFLLIPEQLLGLFGLKDPIVVSLGTQLLRYLSVSGFFITVALTYTGGLQGTGDTRGPLYITLVSQVGIPIGICATLQGLDRLEPAGVWTAILLGHVTRCLLTVGRFRQAKWRSIVVE